MSTLRTRILSGVALCLLVGCGGSSTDITPPVVRDTTAPAVTATTPGNNAVDVALNATATLTFSEPVNPATLTATSVTVVSSAGGAGGTIAGAVTFTGNVATFTPTAPLVGSTRYTVTVTTAVKDLAGNSLASDYVWSFTTIAPPDVTPPTVVSTTPLHDAVNVAVAVAPTVTMSEAMSAATLNASTIVLTKSGDVTPIAGTVTVTVSGTTATLQPTAALTAGTKYTMTVTTGAKDLAGNALAAAASWSFTTVPPPAPELWRSEVPGTVTLLDNAGRTVLDVAGRILLRLSEDNYTALDITTGAVAWNTTRRQNSLSPWTFGSLFVITGLPVDPATGSVLWTPDRTVFDDYSQLLVIGETIILKLPGDTIFVGVERRTGIEKWRTRLGPLNCQGADFCGILRPIGVNGANGYVLRTSSNEAQLITISETGIVREVVTSGDVARRVSAIRQLSAVQGATAIAAWTFIGTAAGIDVVTGAERWRLDLTTIANGFASNPSDKSFYTPDGSLLFLQFDGFSEAQQVLQVILNTSTGAVVSRRVLTRAEYGITLWSRCGDAGLVQLTTSGFDYTNLRTGARSSVVRTGLYDAVVADFMTEMYPVESDRVVISRSNGNAPLLGVKCTP